MSTVVDLAVCKIEMISRDFHTFPLLRQILPKQISDNVIRQALKQMYPERYKEGDFVEEFVRIHTPRIGDHPYTTFREMIIVGYRTVRYDGRGESYPKFHTDIFDVIFPGPTFDGRKVPDKVYNGVADSLQSALVCAAALQMAGNVDNADYIKTVATHFLSGFNSSAPMA